MEMVWTVFILNTYNRFLVAEYRIAFPIFDIINNFSRFFILLELLEIGYQALTAATVASIIASSLSYFAINLIVRRIQCIWLKEKNFLRDTRIQNSGDNIII
jgi:uncharacterized protein (DUF2062 family)